MARIFIWGGFLAWLAVCVYLWLRREKEIEVFSDRSEMHMAAAAMALTGIVLGFAVAFGLDRIFADNGNDKPKTKADDHTSGRSG